MMYQNLIVRKIFWVCFCVWFSVSLHGENYTPLDVTELIADLVSASTNGENDEINLINGPFNLSAVIDTTDGNNGLPSILNDGFSITIKNGTITRNLGNDFRFIRIEPGAHLILDNVSLQNGLANEPGIGQVGGAILNLGVLTIGGSAFIGNTADLGGAIYNDGEITTVTSSLFANNVATSRGGALYNDDGSSISSINNSTFDGNGADQRGGAIFNDGAGEVMGFIGLIIDSTFSLNHVDGIGAFGGAIYNGATISEINSSTFSQNSANASGGGIFIPGNPSEGFDSQGTISFISNSTFSGNIAVNFSGGAISNNVGGVIGQIGNSTIVGNSANNLGGGIYNDATIDALYSTIIAQNSVANGGPDLRMIVNPSSATFNLIGIHLGHSIVDGMDNNKVGTDIIPLDPQLLPLAYNGGPTKTHALQASSPAIDTGDNPRALFFDQRGFSFLRTLGPLTDIGAFEFAQNLDGFAPDHYAAYQLLTTPFYPTTVSLKDQFLDWTEFSVIYPFKLLNPAKKNQNGDLHEINNEKLHYTAFKLEYEGEITINQNVHVSNQFGEFDLSEFKPDHLLVPSQKVEFLPLNHDPSIYNADHYLCYDIPSQSMDTQFGYIIDQFRGRDFRAWQPTRLCNPVAKQHNGKEYGIINDVITNHLMCFSIRDRRIHRNISLLNQFGIQRALVINGDEICIPSSKFLIP